IWRVQRRFVPAWFNEFRTWLKYSVTKDAAFCLYCYLFKPENGDQVGGDSFASKEISNWKKKEMLPFSILIDESFDLEEQMIVIIRYLDKKVNPEFSELKGIRDLAKKLVETEKDKVYSSVYSLVGYSLVTLALILPVVTVTVERALSATNFSKTELRNEIGEQWIKDNLVVYIEQDVFRSILNDAVIEQFQNMKMC
ncbi:hypothetical protein CISIN_1g039143mg, partial [Citrus sinensis]